MCKSTRRPEDVPTRDEMWERKKPAYDILEPLEEARASIVEELEASNGPVFRFVFAADGDDIDYDGGYVACAYLESGARRQALLSEFSQKGYKVLLNFGEEDGEDRFVHVPTQVFLAWPELHDAIIDGMEMFHIAL